MIFSYIPRNRHPPPPPVSTSVNQAVIILAITGCLIPDSCVLLPLSETSCRSINNRTRGPLAGSCTSQQQRGSLSWAPRSLLIHSASLSVRPPVGWGPRGRGCTCDHVGSSHFPSNHTPTFFRFFFLPLKMTAL